MLQQNVLPNLRAAEGASSTRLAEQNSELRSAQWLFVPIALLALATLGLVQWWLAGRTHRVVNPGLAAATVLALVATTIVVVADALDIATAGRLFREHDGVDAGLARAAEGLRSTTLAALLAVLAAAGLAWLGIVRRLEEYR